MTFETLLNDLRNGNSTVYSVGTSQTFKAVNETIDGKETGLKLVKASGGRVQRKIAESILLNGIQSLLVRKGLVEFGNDAVIQFCQTSQMIDGKTVEFTATDLQNKLINNGIEPRFVSAIVSRFLKAIETPMVLTDIQAVEVLQAVCTSEAETAQNVKRATEADRTKAVNEMTAWNDAVLAERQKTLEALKATSATA